jgi:hypothetical protein
MTFGLRTQTPREVQRTSKLDPETGQLSPEAVAGRLEMVGALYKLGVSLMSIRVDQGRPVVSRSK